MPLEFTIQHNARAVAEALGKVPEIAATQIDAALQRGSIEVADEMRARAPKYRSELANSITPERVTLLEHMVRARGKAYGPYVEEGTGPGGWVPLPEILNWIYKKGITPRTPGTSIKQLAALIRLRIGQRGIEANPFAAASLLATRSRLIDLVEGAAQKALDQAAGEVKPA